MIRIAQPTDLINLAALYQKIADKVENPATFNWDFEKAMSEVQIAKNFILEVDQEIKSFISFREGADLIEVTALGTDPSHQKQGLLNLVMAEILAYAAQRRMTISLEVHEKNLAALKLYEKWRFTIIQSRKSYYSDGQTAYVMQNEVNSPKN